MKIGDRLKALRIADGVDRNFVEECTGVYSGTVRKHETHKTKPSFNILKLYAEFYGLTLSELLEGVVE